VGGTKDTKVTKDTKEKEEREQREAKLRRRALRRGRVPTSVSLVIL
jgi:hypothetical protein